MVHAGCVVSMINFIELPEVDKTLVKILGGRQHRTTPAGQILGGSRDPCNPCGVDACGYGHGMQEIKVKGQLVQRLSRNKRLEGRTDTTD